MKAANFVGLTLAVSLSALAWWSSQTSQTLAQSELQRMQQALENLHEQMQQLHQAQILGSALTPGREDRSSQPIKGGDATKLTNRVSNQGRANDNQWQEIDALKSDQQFQKRQIDQLNFEIGKLQREFRALQSRSSRR